jgi:hypothetical protein
VSRFYKLVGWVCVWKCSISFFRGSTYNKAEAQKQLDESNKGHQMLRKMGWGGAGLGAKEQGIEQPISGGEVGIMACWFYIRIHHSKTMNCELFSSVINFLGIYIKILISYNSDWIRQIFKINVLLRMGSAFFGTFPLVAWESHWLKGLKIYHSMCLF